MPQPAPGPRASAEVRLGLAALLHGFRLWGRSPTLMLLGMVPALIVGVAFVAVWLLLAWRLAWLADLLTPFADGWSQGWRAAVRATVGGAVLVLATMLLVVAFTTVTLAVGGPFYERIATEVEVLLGAPPDRETRSLQAQLVRSARDGASMLTRGLLLAGVLAVVGLVPVVGGTAALALGAVAGGRLVTIELTGTASDARGLDLAARRALLRRFGWRSGAFGAAVYLLLLVPVVAVVTMPAAVAGATVLARGMLAEPDRP